MNESEKLSRLADGVADGSSVDWDETLSGERSVDPDVVSELQEISRVADFYRELHGPLEDEPDPDADRARAPHGVKLPTRRRLVALRRTSWLLLIPIALAAAKTVLALVALPWSILGRAGESYGADWIYIAAVLTFSSCAGALLLANRSDSRSIPLGGLYLLVAATFADRLLAAQGSAAALVLRAFELSALAPAYLWLFVAQFPRLRTFRAVDRLPTLMAPISGVVGVLLVLANLVIHWLPAGRSSQAEEIDALLGRTGPGSLYWLIVLSLVLFALGALFWKARGAAATERNRVVWFALALAAGALPLVVQVVLRETFPGYSSLFDRPATTFIDQLLVYSALLSIPVTTTYFVLTERLLDVRLVVRYTLRHSLARYLLLAIAVSPSLLLGIALWRGRDQDLLELLSRPGTVVLAVLSATSLILAIALRDRVRKALDRRYYREDYDPSLELLQLGADLRRTNSPSALAEALVRHVRSTLHPRTTVVLLRRPRSRELEAHDDSVPPISVETSLIRDLSVSDGPLTLESSIAHAHGDLPARETQWLVESELCVFAELRDSSDQMIAALGAGPRRGGVPYTKKDLAFLQAAAETGAVMLETMRLRPTGRQEHASPSDEPTTGEEDQPFLVECRDCGAVWPSGVEQCEKCGQKTARSSLPVVLSEKFEIVRRIGSGGMGVVYHGTDRALDRQVAIKTLPEVSASRSWRLRREARAMAQVTHPNLALLYGAEALHKTPILIFEYLSGGTLADRLEIGVLPPNLAVEIALAIAGALESLHAKGILHRDIKPSNIGFDEREVPKLLDLGIARMLSRDDTPDGSASPTGLRLLAEDAQFLATQTMRTPTGVIVGTPLYLSPEAVTLDPPSPHLDLWSLAVVLYESVAGVNPLSRASQNETLEAVALGEILDIRDTTPDCPEPLALFLLDSLAHDRHRRPATAAEFKETLRRVRGLI